MDSEKPNMASKGQHYCPQIDHIMLNVADDFISGEGGDVEDDYHVDENEQVEFFTALLKHCSEPTIFLVKGMEALRTIAKEPLYEESKCCIKEYAIL